MQKRRSHTKSRRGCKGCKEKHIKCDEQGPPCANCKSRGLPCAYPQQRSSRGSGGGGPSKLSSSPSTSSSSSSSTQLSPRPSISAHLLPIDSSPTRRLLELELMHRWSTRTYKGMCGIPSDAALMQLELPRQGLSEHPSLLHGILALSALDMATTTPDPRQVHDYHRTALEYYGHATRAFQAEMVNITRQNHFALYMLSAFFGVFHSAVLHLPSITDGKGSSSSSGGPAGGKEEEEQQVKMPPNSVLDRIPEMFALQRGTAVIASKTFVWLHEDYESFRLVREMGGAPASLLDADTRRALARLGVVNDMLYGIVRTPSSAEADGDGDGGFDDGGGEGVEYGDIAIKAMLHPSHETYAAAITDLRRCFAEHARGWIDGFVMAFPMWMGKDIVSAMERRDDPMALLVLMYFGVLLEFNGRNQWWCASLGTKLVMEISDVFVRSGREYGPEFWDAVAWARRKCGLSAGGVVSSSSQDGRSGEVEVLE